MNLRIHLASSLFAFTLAGLLPAQDPQPAPQPKPEQGPPAPAKLEQEPEKAVVPDTPQMRIARLEREQARLQQELDFLKQSRQAGSMVQMLQRQQSGRKLNSRAIDAGVSAPPPVAPVATPPGAAPQMQRAHLMSPDEVANVGADVMMTVAGRPITQGEIDAQIAYLSSFKGAGDPTQQYFRAFLESIRREAMHAAFAEGAAAAEARILELEKKLQDGADFAELVKLHSKGPSPENGGDIGVLTRNSAHGLFLEMAAFATEPGKVSKVFKTAQGYNLLKVESFLKGETPDADRMNARLLLIPFHDNVDKLREAMGRIGMGGADMAVRDQATMDRLPPIFRPLPTAPPTPTEDVIKEPKPGDAGKEQPKPVGNGEAPK